MAVLEWRKIETINIGDLFDEIGSLRGKDNCAKLPKSSAWISAKPRMEKYGKRNAGRFLIGNEHQDMYAERTPQIDFARWTVRFGKTWAKLGQRIGLEYTVLRPVARVSATESARLRIDLSG